MANQWLNNDGLLVKFGTKLGVPGKAGTYKMTGPLHVLEIKDLDLTTLVDDATTLVDGMAQGIIDQHNVIPSGVQIEKVEVLPTEAATGTNAVLDIGVVDTDFASNDDDDALVIALAQTALTPVGTVATYIQGTSGHGVLVGEQTTKSYYVTASYDTAAFTDGTVTIRIYYSK